jgi:hypothetical protein
VAVPALNVPVPSVVFPCRNVTVSPSGGAGETTAVNVTACPYTDGFREDDSVVVVVVKAALRLEAVASIKTIRIVLTFIGSSLTVASQVG